MKGIKKTKKKYSMNIILIGMILGLILWGIWEYIKDNNIKKEVNYQQTQKVSSQGSTNSTQEEDKNRVIEKNIEKKEKSYPKEEVIKEYKGYDVAAKLEIPAISLDTYVLENYSISALKVSVTKFWGAGPNQTGNFCIAGHNFKNTRMFRNLKKLKIGDNMYVTDNHIGKVEYEIYDIYRVLPEDVSCLGQETNGRKEVTLITCTSDSKERIIVKAKEIE